MEPLRIDRNIETLDVAPSRLFVGIWVVAKVHSHYIVRPECLFYGPYDGCLRLTLWKIIGDECRANP